MGKGQSKLSRSELEILAEKTKFEPSKIRMWHKGFMADCPEGHITIEYFDRIYKQFYPFGDSTDFSRRLFMMFKPSQDGTIKFPEFMEVLSITGCGDTDAKLRWAFELYDLDGDHMVTYDEMVTVIGYIYSMVGPMVRLPPDEDTAEKRVAKMFAAWGIPKEQSLDIQQFIELSKQTPRIIHAVGLYDGLV